VDAALGSGEWRDVATVSGLMERSILHSTEDLLKILGVCYILWVQLIFETRDSCRNGFRGVARGQEKVSGVWEHPGMEIKEPGCGTSY
jgi:hypothetical protein